MDSGGLVRPCLLLVISICVFVVSGNPLHTTVIDCTKDSLKAFGPVDEGYEGDVELVNGITAGSGVKLVPYIFDKHLEYLELSFMIGDTSATVRTKKPLDADTLMDSGGTLFYSIMCDGVIEYNNTRGLKINDLNDNSPIFEEKLYSQSVSESEPVGFEVVRVTATDADITNNAITYSIEPASEVFEVTSAGAVRLKKRLNYNSVKQYNFTVRASDPLGSSDTATVVINVEDFDNLNPYFSHSLYRAFIPENQGGPFPTIEPEAIKAQDGDTGINVALIYSISEVSPAEYQSNFQIDSSSGVLSVQTPVDREEMSSSVITVNIKAAQTDDILKTANAVVSVTIEDVNDNAPKFDQSSYSVSLPENSLVDAVVLKVVVTDLDQGGFVGTLRILPESAPFSIGSDGTVRVKNSTALDRETTTSFTFQIEAAETNPPNNVATAEVSVTLLDENDNSPVFTSDTYEGKVFANQTEGMFLVQVEAEDVDDGANGQITYSIDFGNTDGYFSIEDKTGTVTLAKVIPLVENILLHVTARDGGTVSRSTTAQVIIRVPGNSKPQFLQRVYHGTVAEEQDPQVVILTVNFQVIPEEKPVTLRVDTHSDKFSISPTGEFTTMVKLDCDEGPHNYSVTISISDGVDSDSAVVEVQVTDVNDNNPVFAPSSVTTSVPEDSEVGSNVTVVPATDKDSSFNKEIRYSLRGGEGRFDIDPVSGMVSVVAALDRETKAEYNLLVVAEDQGRPARSATASLLVQVSDVNDNVPQFPAIADPLQIPEGNYTEENPGDIVTIVPTDADLGPNGEVTLSLTSPHPLFRFREDGTLLAVGALDRESRETYELLVKASDNGTPQRENITTIRVSLTDVNDNKPEFSSSSYVSSILLKDAEKGKLLLTLEATDKDAGDNSRITYSFSAGSSPYLALDSTTGAVTLTSDLADVKEDTTLVLTAMAEDHGEPPLNSTARVVVNLRVVSLVEGVAFGSSSYNFSIPEHRTVGTTVGTVFASSGSDLYNVSYTLKKQTDLFSIDASGAIKTKAELDKEEKEWYVLDVEAVDTRTPPTTAVATVTVQVEDVNEPPQFSKPLYEASIVSIDVYETPVVTVEASDPDVGDQGCLVYSLEDATYFDVDPSTGLVFVVSAVELAGQKVELKVHADDLQGLRATTTVEVTVGGSLSSSDVVVIRLNQPANTVENKIPDMESSLTNALGWTVDVIKVSNANRRASESRIQRAAVWTRVSFICLDGGTVVSGEEVTTKLQSQSEAVREELVTVFGDSVQFEIESEPEGPASNQAVAIAMGVLVPLIVVGLIVFALVRRGSIRRLVDFKKGFQNEEEEEEEKENPLGVLASDVHKGEAIVKKNVLKCPPESHKAC